MRACYRLDVPRLKITNTLFASVKAGSAIMEKGPTLLLLLSLLLLLLLFLLLLLLLFIYFLVERGRYPENPAISDWIRERAEFPSR